MNYQNRIPDKNPDLAWREIDSEIIIVSLNSHPKAEKITMLNETAAKVWQLIDGKKQVSVLIKEAMDKYKGNTLKIESDIKNLLKDMAKRSLVYFRK